MCPKVLNEFHGALKNPDTFIEKSKNLVDSLYEVIFMTRRRWNGSQKHNFEVSDGYMLMFQMPGNK